MTAGTIVVPIAPDQRSYWQLHLEAFAAAVAAVTAVLNDGAGPAAQRYAARRHQAHPVWAAWASVLACAQAGKPAAPPPSLILQSGGDLPLALPERPGLRLRGLIWPPQGSWQLDWGPGQLLFHAVGVEAGLGAPPGRGAGRWRQWLGRGRWLPLLGLPLVVAPVASGEAGGAAAITYEAARGETLRLVAQRLWGEPRAWPLLWRANRDQVPNPGFLTGGTQLAIPDELPRPEAIEPPPYRVQAGDTLWDIAGKVYGDSWAWPLVWGANRQQVGDPHRIFPDQRFIYPTDGDLYVIQPGDSLWAVAESHYGSGHHWRRVWQANRGWLSDPDRLPAGYRLWLPG